MVDDEDFDSISPRPFVDWVATREWLTDLDLLS